MTPGFRGLPDIRQLRYVHDDPARYGLEAADRPSEDQVRSRGLAQNVRVSDRVLPRLFAATREAAERLGFTEPTTVFVFASAESNALCHTDSGRGEVLVFVSSALVTGLRPPEWACILGHELGHHRLEHHRYPPAGTHPLNLRALELRRAAEISADRAGLIACGDIDIALRAMLKVTSGLDESNLEIDVADYLRQVEELRDTSGDESIFFSTHPPFTVRARALLRFEGALRRLQSGEAAEGVMRETDEAIERDLEAVTSGSAGNRFTDQGRAAAFWAAAESLCRDGAFSAADQAAMRRQFGDDRVDALRRLLSESGSKQEALATLAEKAESSRRDLETAPLIARRRFDELMAAFAPRIGPGRPA